MTGATFREEDLHAFIDGELDDAASRAVAAALAADPVLAERVEAYRADKALLAAHYGPLIDRPVPAAWTQMIAAPAPAVVIPLQRRRFEMRPLLALAASLVLLVTGWAGYQRFERLAGDEVVAAAVSLHGHDGGQQIAADAGQISAALGQNLKLPDLTKAGYTLADVAVYPSKTGKGVKIAYRNASGEPFTLYLQASSGKEAFDITKHGDLLVCLWQDDVLATVMVGKMSAAEMLRVASLAYNGLYF